MRICYTSDLHGRENLYEQLGRLIRDRRPELLVLGGDMFPDGDAQDPPGSQMEYVRRTFVPRLESWKNDCPGLIVACIPGNHDWLCTEQVLEACHQAGQLILLSERQVQRLGSVGFLGYCKTPPSPHTVKDFERLDSPSDPLPLCGGAVWDAVRRTVRAVDPPEHFRRPDAITVELEGLPDAAPPWVFVCHAPPYETRLDRLPGVDSPIGSRAVRRFIERRNPLVALHGHVHESPLVTGSYTDWLGPTLCINPGQHPDRLHAVLFDTERPGQTVWHTVYG